MNSQPNNLTAGLYLIATPLGTARDITLRALDILGGADVLVAEDTRSLRRLMELHAVPLRNRKILSYHDHNGAKMRPKILAELAAGKSVAYASEAGTPMVADPGFDLARAAVAAGHALVSAPGPSSVITALTVSGLPTDRFFFAGFLPATAGRRKSVLSELKDVPGTLVFFESPNRVSAMLADAAEALGAERDAAVCRELTKKFEEVRRGSLAVLAASTKETPPKGEVVVVIGRPLATEPSEDDVAAAIHAALATNSVKDAAEQVATELGMKKRDIYQLALKIRQER